MSMFSIGEFARHGRISVRMLRHYDAIGVLVPATVDPVSGYRFYQAGQLSRLNRIIALKDLGFSLRQVQQSPRFFVFEPEEEFMSTARQITERAEQPYVAVKAQVTNQNISAIADRIPRSSAGWPRRRRAGRAPFLKYNVIDMARQLEIKAGDPSPPSWTVTAACCRASCPRGGTRP